MKKKLSLLVLASAFFLVGVTACGENDAGGGETGVCAVTDEVKSIAVKAYNAATTSYSDWSSTGISTNQALTTEISKNSEDGTKSYEFVIAYSVPSDYAANLAIGEDGKTLVVTAPNTLEGGTDVHGKIKAKVTLKGCTTALYEAEINVLVKAVTKMNLDYIYEVDADGKAVVAADTEVSLEAIYMGAYPGQGWIFGDGDHAILAFDSSKKAATADYEVGAAYSINGSVTDYSGLRELSSGAKIKKLDSVPSTLTTPATLEMNATNAREFKFGDDSRFVRVSNAKVLSTTVKSDSGNLTVTLSLGDVSVTAFMNATYSKDVIDSWKKTRAGATEATLVQAGDVVTFTGYVNAFNNVFQVVYGNVEEWEEAPLSVAAPSQLFVGGETGSVSVSLTGDVTPTSVTCTSSDPTVVSVEADGSKLTALKEGEAKISVVVVANGKTYTDSVTVSTIAVQPVVKTIAEIKAMASSSTKSYVWDTTTIYEVNGVLEGKKGDKYGDAYLTDPSTGDSVIIYGMSGKLYNGFSKSGNKWKYSNPTDALTTAADINNGDKVKMYVMFEDAKGVANIAGCVVTHEADTTTKYASSITAGENGTATLSVTDPAVYGTKITVNATPAEGYAVDAVTVTTAYGTTTVKADADGIYSYTVTCKNVVNVTFKKDIATVTDTWTVKDNTTFSNSAVSGTTAVDSTVTAKFATNGDITMEAKGIKTFDSNATIFIPQNSGYIYNTQAFPHAILSVELTTSSSASKSAKYAVNFGTSALSTLNTANATAIGKDTSGTIKCTVENATYFQIATTGANGQIVSVKITYAA